MFFRTFTAAIFAATGAFANTDARTVTDVVFEMAESRLDLAQFILRTSVDYVAENPDVDPSEGHLALKRILNGNKQFRAILSINENGLLDYDSYNAVPLGALPDAPSPDFSSRKYFRSTTNSPNFEMVINDAVVGRQSGETFIPLSMSVPNETGFRQRVVMLTASPKGLLPPIEVCSYCGVVLVHKGKVLTSSHPMSSINESVIERLSFDGNYGANEFVLRGMSVGVHWRKSQKTGVVVLFYQASPQTEG